MMEIFVQHKLNNLGVKRMSVVLEKLLKEEFDVQMRKIE